MFLPSDQHPESTGYDCIVVGSGPAGMTVATELEKAGRRTAGASGVNSDALYREATGGGHIMGTTRMGSGRADSVVDRHCRVHGYENFFVAGSSVFPTGGFANPTFTIVALAVRLADEIARRG